MVLTYRDGRQVEAIILSRSEDRMRVAVRDCDDPVELINRNGTWVTEDCEPVRVEFAWQVRRSTAIPPEADCVCSHELAARLIGLMLRGSEEEDRTIHLVSAAAPWQASLMLV